MLSFQYIGYGVTTISSLNKIIGLFCRILSLLYGSSAKENCNFKEPTSRSHPIVEYIDDSVDVGMGCLWLVGSIKL